MKRKDRRGEPEKGRNRDISESPRHTVAASPRRNDLLPPARSEAKVHDSSAESLFLKGLKELSLAPAQDQVRLFLRYLEELKKWNKAYNLTSLKSDEDIIVKHFLDSLLYLKVLPGGGITVVDVGSGGGFPGIPVKIMRPEIFMYLLEPSRKKAMFLRHVVKILGLEAVEVIEKRVEDLKDLTGDVALTRALFTVKDFYTKAVHLIKPGGILVLSKGPKVSEELVEAGREGLKWQIARFPVPLSDMIRSIVVIRNESGEEILLAEQEAPRPVGKKRPCIPNICVNAECRLRKAGCTGFEGCPGFKARD